MRAIRRALIATGATGALVCIGSGAPIQAADSGVRGCSETVYHGDDFGRGNNCGGLADVTAWDNEADGRGVRVEYYLGDGGPMLTLRDSDGSAGQGAFKSYSDTWVSQIRVCESTAGCSGWKYPTWRPLA